MLMMKERRPYPARVGARVSAKRGHNPRMRGARLDAGPRWPACPGARLLVGRLSRQIKRHLRIVRKSGFVPATVVAVAAERFALVVHESL